MYLYLSINLRKRLYGHRCCSVGEGIQDIGTMSRRRRTNIAEAKLFSISKCLQQLCDEQQKRLYLLRNLGKPKTFRLLHFTAFESRLKFFFTSAYKKFKSPKFVKRRNDEDFYSFDLLNPLRYDKIKCICEPLSIRNDDY